MFLDDCRWQADQGRGAERLHSCDAICRGLSRRCCYSIGFPIVPAHVLEPALAAGNFNPHVGYRHAAGQVDFARRLPDGSLCRGAANRVQALSVYWMRDDHGGQLPRLHGQVLLIVPDQKLSTCASTAGSTDVYSPRPEEVRRPARNSAAQLNINGRASRYRYRIAVFRLQSQSAPLHSKRRDRSALQMVYRSQLYARAGACGR